MKYNLNFLQLTTIKFKVVPEAHTVFTPDHADAKPTTTTVTTNPLLPGRQSMQLAQWLRKEPGKSGVCIQILISALRV